MGHLLTSHLKDFHDVEDVVHLLRRSSSFSETVKREFLGAEPRPRSRTARQPGLSAFSIGSR